MKLKLLSTLLFLCISTSIFSQVANQPGPILICDNIGDNDGFGQFDLAITASQILGSQNSNDFSITYYATEADAINDFDPLPIIYENISNPQTIFVRVTENSSGNFDTTSFQITVSLLPELIQPSILQICGFGNDGIGTFDLTQSISEILGGQNQNQFSVSFYFEGVFISNPFNFTNSVNPTTLEVLVANNNTGCQSITTLTLRVLPSPQSSPVSDVIFCEVNTDGFVQFDLSIKDLEVLNGQNPSNYTVTYHVTQADADQVLNPLSSPFTNTSNPQEIFVAITDNNTGCFSTGASFFIIVNPSPQPNLPVPLVVCDPDGDGFAQFDLESKTAEILDGMDPFEINVTYHETQADAEFDLNPLMSPYDNIIANAQTIFVRVENAFGCFAFVTLELLAIDCSNVGQIVVDAFLDSNGNSVFDTDETHFTNGYFTYEINNDGVTRVVSSSTGQFILYSQNDTDSYDITYTLNDGNASCYSVVVSSFDAIIASSGTVVNVEFPVITADSCQDLAVYLYNPSASPRPGFNYTNKITLQNLGNETISTGTVEYLYDAQLQFNGVTSINSNYTVTPISGGVSIDFVDIIPIDIEDIFISLYCPTTLTLGTLVTNVATYTTPESDFYAVNDISTLSQTVIGSYDPNDINESHGPKIIYDDFAASDEFLYYLIRFQNVGTAEAINIKIEDVLDAQLDGNTFEMLLSSHDNVVTQSGNEFIWQFDDINLPSESMDAEGSNGFVYFKIKPQVGYAIGDVIPNVAEIYFDFNAAITTNTFNTEFVQALSVNEFEITGFSVYPNPANSSLRLQFNSVLNGVIMIYDIQGKSILNKTFANENSVQLDVSTFESGLYFVKLNTGSIEITQKLIIY